VILALSSVLVLAAAEEPENRDNTNWNAFVRTWRNNNNDSFVPLPTTTTEAQAQGWKLDAGCPQISGYRYIMGTDRMVMPIYDANGNVCGISAAIAQNAPFNFPSPNIQQFFTNEGDGYWTLTAYFTEPSTICTPGRAQPIGNTLILQNTIKNQVVPLYESDLTSFWTMGGCFHTMGQHYWADISGSVNVNTKSDNLLPFFILYNKGLLNGFGWSLNYNSASPHVEHMPLSSLPIFFNEIPLDFYNPALTGTLSSMHVFLTNNFMQNFC